MHEKYRKVKKLLLYRICSKCGNCDIKEGFVMSERELAKQIIDKLPEYKISSLLLFLRGIQFDDDIEDDLYCKKLVEEYLNNPDPEKHETVTLEELAAREGIAL